MAEFEKAAGLCDQGGRHDRARVLWRRAWRVAGPLAMVLPRLATVGLMVDDAALAGACSTALVALILPSGVAAALRHAAGHDRGSMWPVARIRQRQAASTR